MPDVAVGGRARRLGAALLLGALLLAGCSSGPESSGGFVRGRPWVTPIAPADRQPAPEVSGRRLGDGGTITAAAYAGKVVVLNVWGSWCAPCRKEAPDLQAASTDTRDSAQFLGLNTRDADPAPAQAFVRAFSISYPSIYDPQGKVLLRFAGQLPPNGIPSTLVIDRQGRLAARIVGPISRASLVDLVEDVASGR